MQNKLLILIPILILVLITVPVFAQTDNELNNALEQIWFAIFDNTTQIDIHKIELNKQEKRIDNLENHTNLWINQTLQNDNEILQKLAELEEKQNNISIIIKCEGCN